MSYFKCYSCGNIRESEENIVICKICGQIMQVTPFTPCSQVEVKNPYPNTDLYGQVIHDE